MQKNMLELRWNYKNQINSQWTDMQFSIQRRPLFASVEHNFYCILRRDGISYDNPKMIHAMQHKKNDK